MKDPELIIENLEGEGQEGAEMARSHKGKAIEAPSETVGGDSPSETAGGDKESTLRRLKAQASEDDDAPVGSLTFKKIIGGDLLLALVRHYVWLIVLVVLLTCVYVGVRYQCQQDVIEISRLEKELVDAKYRAMSSSSNLTELCRQSNVLKVLGQDENNKLELPEKPPYIIEVGE